MHVDLIRNDWQAGQQMVAARIYVDPDGYGVLVKDADGHWEGNIFDALGPIARETGDRIVARLHDAFHGPYLTTSDPHDDVDCPFEAGTSPIDWKPVTGQFTLPRATSKTSGRRESA